MRYESITLESRGAVGLLTLNRPQRLNAMNAPMLEEILHALDAVERDDALRALVVTGAGKAFSSGFDLQDQAANTPRGKSEWRPALQRDFDAVMRFWTLSKPTISAVNGPALAGGCEMAVACDLTIAGESAIFGEPEVKFGAGIVAMLLPRLAPPKRAKEIILLGLDNVPAAEAMSLGLVNRVVPDAAVLETAMALADRMAVIDPMVIRRTKQAINACLDAGGLADGANRALAIDLELEGEGSVDKRDFLARLRAEGMRGALAWRDARFDGSQGG